MEGEESAVHAEQKPESLPPSDGKAEKEPLAVKKDANPTTSTGNSEEEEGLRAKLMRDSFARCRRRFISNISPVHRFFPYLKGRKGAILKGLTEQMTAQLAKFIDEEFEQILMDHGMVPKLNKLDAIILDPANHTADGAPAWRPSGSAEKDIAAHDTTSARSAATLKQKLAELELETKHLREDVACRRQVLDVAMRRMEQMWQKVTKLESAMEENPLDNIAAFNDQQRLPVASLTPSTRGRKRKRKQ